MKNDSILNTSEIESGIIAGVLVDNTCLDDIPFIRPCHFHAPLHQRIWESFTAMHNEGLPIDPISVRDRYKCQPGDPPIVSYLSELVDSVFTTGHVGRYAQQLRDVHTRRELVRIADDLHVSAASSSDKIEEIIDKAESRVFSLRRQPESEALAAPAVVASALTEIRQRVERRGQVVGVSSGYPDLDRLTSGFRGGQFIVVAARPSMGKTALLINMATNCGEPTLFFSLEMGSNELMGRVLSYKSRVSMQAIRNGKMSDGQFEALREAGNLAGKMPLMIDETPSMSILDMRARARRTMRKSGLKMIMVDYLQLVRPIRREDKREREVASMSRGFKLMAKELGVPVIVACQLNRALETGGKPRKPILSDLRESGAIEQDADLVLFPWREAAYCEECREAGYDCGKGHYSSAELIVAKQRNGPTGVVPLTWFGEITRFESVAKVQDDEVPM